MKILIVDGEPGVARRLAEGVVAAGFEECFPAETAEEAVEIANREQALDVLVTNVQLADIDGLTLFATLRQYFPELRAIFLAGENDDDREARATGWPVLPEHIEAGALVFALGHPAVPEVPAEPEPDPLLGAMLGNIRVDTFLGTDPDGNFYHAVQTNIDRPVELHTLDTARAADPAEVERFLADARTKANVHHTGVLSVFEAGQQGNVYFYTSETRVGSSVATLVEQGTKLESRVVLQVIHLLAEVMVHLGHGKIAHEPIRAEHIIIDHRQRARLVNTAIAEARGRTVPKDIHALAKIITPIVEESPQSHTLRQLLFEMESESVTVRSWNALLYEVKRCSSGTVSPHVHKLDASGRAAIEAVGAARKRQRTTRTVLIVVVVLLLGAAAVWAWMTFFMTPAPERNIPTSQSIHFDTRQS